MKDLKPNVFISKCIEQDMCRWNGTLISSQEVRALLPFINVISHCPETELGLGIPRDPIRIEMHDNYQRLVQPNTKKDLTDDMLKYAHKITARFHYLDGFIMKSKSPSCGIREVKVYTADTKAKSSVGTGFFTQVILDRFADLPIEDEGRLTNHKLREHFYTAIFTLARFRTIYQNLKMSDLVKFHANHKFLYLAYNQKQMRIMGKITANQAKNDVHIVFDEYYTNLKLVFKNQPRINNILNVWEHIMGFFSEKISATEKAHLLETMDSYLQDQIPGSVITELLYALSVRFNDTYLLEQYFFKPFPKELMTIHDSAKRRL